MSSEKYSARPLPAGDELHCPRCDARIQSAAAKECWLCGQDFATSAPITDAAARIQELSSRIDLRQPRGDSPALILFGVLAIILCIGLMLRAPGIPIVLLILAVPALIRTVHVSSRRQAAGAPPDRLSAVGIFLSSIGVVAMVGLASVAAFYATCFAVCWGGIALTSNNRGHPDWGVLLVASVGAGLVPGFAVAFLLFRRLWGRKG